MFENEAMLGTSRMPKQKDRRSDSLGFRARALAAALRALLRARPVAQPGRAAPLRRAPTPGDGNSLGFSNSKLERILYNFSHLF